MWNSSCSKRNYFCRRKGWLSMDANVEVDYENFKKIINVLLSFWCIIFSDFGGIFGFSLGISMISFFTCFQWLYEWIVRTLTCKDLISTFPVQNFVWKTEFHKYFTELIKKIPTEMKRTKTTSSSTSDLFRPSDLYTYL